MQVHFITVDDGDDLIVSFGLEQYAQRSLTLLRTPKYESFLPEEERGVSVGTDTAKNLERELLVSVHWKRQSVNITTNLRVYDLDISSVGAEELSEAKVILKSMNFDNQFEIHGI